MSPATSLKKILETSDSYDEMADFLIKYLSHYTYFKDFDFLKSKVFKDLLVDILSVDNTDELKKHLILMAHKISENVDLPMVNDDPIIWTNYSLSPYCYSGSGGGVGTEFGFGSEHDMDLRGDGVDVFSIVKKSVLMASSLFNSGNFKPNDFWKFLAADRCENKENSVLYQILGLAWLEVIPANKLRDFDIKYEKMFFYRDPSKPEMNLYMPLDCIITYNLLPRSLELAAEHNRRQTNDSDKIYFDRVKKLPMMAKKDVFNGEELAKIGDRTKEYILAELSLKELILSLEKISEKMDTLEKRKAYIKSKFLIAAEEQGRVVGC